MATIQLTDDLGLDETGRGGAWRVVPADRVRHARRQSRKRSQWPSKRLPS